MLDTMVIFSGVVNIILSGRMEILPDIYDPYRKNRSSFRFVSECRRGDELLKTVYELVCAKL